MLLRPIALARGAEDRVLHGLPLLLVVDEDRRVRSEWIALTPWPDRASFTVCYRPLASPTRVMTTQAPIDPAEDFRDRFVVRVEDPERPKDHWGTGMLLAPRVVATCRHVVERLLGTKVRVRLDDRSALALARTWPDDDQDHPRDTDQDVALLLLEEPIVPDETAYPALVLGMGAATHRRLESVLSDDPDGLVSCGYQRGGPKLTRASIDSVTRNQEGVIDWVRLDQSHRKGESGGPIWLVPPTALPAGADRWRPGLVLGLVAQGAKGVASGGPPHSFAVTTDTLHTLRTALHDSAELPEAHRQALDEIRTVPADKAARWAEQPRTEVVPAAELQTYLRKADSLYKELPLAGFETRVRVTIELDDLHVPLDGMIDESAEPHQIFTFEDADQADEHHAARGRRHQLPLAEAFVEARTRGQRGVILLGDPGSGKTTHLKQILLKVQREGPQSIGLPGHRARVPGAAKPSVYSEQRRRRDEHSRRIARRRPSGAHQTRAERRLARHGVGLRRAHVQARAVVVPARWPRRGGRC